MRCVAFPRDTSHLNTTTAGNYYGQISLGTNDSDENPYNFQIAGAVLSSQPDLDVLYTPTLSSSTVVRGNSVTFSYDVDNLGVGNAGSSTTGIYLSTDSTITTADTFLTSDAVASILAGSYSSESLSVTIPGTLASGTYYLGAIADYSNAISESNESNNPSVGVAISVTAPPGVTINGTAAADIIDATTTVLGQPLPTEGDDRIYGLGDADTISALGGNDILNGGGGAIGWKATLETTPT